MSLYSYASTLTWMTPSEPGLSCDAYQASAPLSLNTPATTAAADASALTPAASAWARDYDMWWSNPYFGVAAVLAGDGASMLYTPSSSTSSSLAQLNVTQMGILYECVTSPDAPALDNCLSPPSNGVEADHEKPVRSIAADAPSSAIRLLSENVHEDANDVAPTQQQQQEERAAAPVHVPELGDSATLVGESHGSTSLTAPTTEPASTAIKWRVGGRPAPLSQEDAAPAALPFSPLRSLVADSLRTYYFPSGLDGPDELHTPSTHGTLGAQTAVGDVAAGGVEEDDKGPEAPVLSATRRPTNNTAEADVCVLPMHPPCPAAPENTLLFPNAPSDTCAVRPATSPLTRRRPPCGGEDSSDANGPARAPQEHLTALHCTHGRRSCPPVASTGLHAEEAVPTVVASDRALRYMRLGAIFRKNAAGAVARRGVAAMPVSVSTLRASVMESSPRVQQCLSRHTTTTADEDASLYATVSCVERLPTSFSSTQTVHPVRQRAKSTAAVGYKHSFSSVRTVVVANPVEGVVEAEERQPCRDAVLPSTPRRTASSTSESPRRYSAPAGKTGTTTASLAVGGGGHGVQRGDVVEALSGAAAAAGILRSYVWDQAAPTSTAEAAPATATAVGSTYVHVHPRAPPSPSSLAPQTRFRRYPSHITPVSLPPPRRMSGRTAPVVTDTAPLPGKRYSQKPAPLISPAPRDSSATPAAARAAKVLKKMSPNLMPVTGSIAPPTTPLNGGGLPLKQRPSITEPIPLVRSRVEEQQQQQQQQGQARQVEEVGAMVPQLPPITPFKLALLTSEDVSQLQTPRNDSSYEPSQASPEWKHVPVPVLRRSLIARVAPECARGEVIGSSVLSLHPRHC